MRPDCLILCVWNQVGEVLENDAVVKIQDFLENYTCLLQKEVQSLHWNQEQCTVYPVVALRKIDSEVWEAHYYDKWWYKTWSLICRACR